MIMIRVFIHNISTIIRKYFLGKGTYILNYDQCTTILTYRASLSCSERQNSRCIQVDVDDKTTLVKFGGDQLKWV